MANESSCLYHELGATLYNVYSQHYWRFLNVSCWYNLIIKVQEIFLHTSEVDLWILINIYIENEAIAWW